MSINKIPNFACANMNLKEGEFNVSFEDKHNHVKVYAPLGTSINYGDCFKLEGIKRIDNRFNNSSSFDYRRYMFSKKILYIANVERYQYTNKNIISRVKTLRDKLIKYNCQKNESTCPIINQLLFGEKALNDEEKDLYGKVGLAPVFAISGLHITFFFNAILYFLAKLRVVQEDSKKIGFGLLAIYSILAGGSVSVKRAILMLGLQIFGKLSSLKSLCIAFIIFLIVNPFIILNSGFQLSFLITAVILIIPYKVFDSEFYNSIWLSYICYFMALPVSYHFNYSFNILAPICILIVTPIIITTLIPCSMLATLLNFKIIYVLISIQVLVIDSIANFFNTFTIVGGHITLLMWLLYLVLITLIIRYSELKFIKYIVVWFAIVSVDLTITPQISFIDVGQGDSALVETLFKNYLIDVGNEPNEVATELSYLDAVNIDEAFISHAHLDHYGSMSELPKDVHIKNVYELKGNQIISGSTGISEYQKYNNIEIIPYYGSNENDRELIVRFTIGKYSILFPGDVELESEEYLVKNYCDEIESTVIKVPHHGSRTSSSDQFLDCVNPDIAIISSGKHNMYHHPSTEIVEKYRARTLLYNTQEVGEVKLRIRRSGIEIWTKEKLR